MKQKKNKTNLKGLTILLDARSSFILDWIHEEKGGGYYICPACGGCHKHSLMIKHKSKCLYKAHYKALDILRELLGIT